MRLNQSFSAGGNVRSRYSGSQKRTARGRPSPVGSCRSAWRGEHKQSRRPQLLRDRGLILASRSPSLETRAHLINAGSARTPATSHWIPPATLPANERPHHPCAPTFMHPCGKLTLHQSAGLPSTDVRQGPLAKRRVLSSVNAALSRPLPETSRDCSARGWSIEWFLAPYL